MVLLLFLFIALLAVTLGAITLGLAVTGNWRWDAQVRRDALRIHSGGTALGTALAWLLLGAHATLAAWPVLVGFLAVRLGGTALLDLLHGTRPRVPRVIEHRDGRRALVDARRGAGYQRMEE